jgi:hypothetical protein
MHGSFFSNTISDCIFYLAGIEGLTVDGTYINDLNASAYSLFEISADPTIGSAKDVHLQGFKDRQESLMTLLEVSDLGQNQPIWASSWNVEEIPKFDAGEIYGSDPTAYTIIASSSNVLTITDESANHNGIPLYRSVQTGSGGSDYMGFTFALSEFEDYDDYNWYVTLPVKADVGTPGFELYVDNGSGSLVASGGFSALINGAWSSCTMLFKGNGSGTVRVCVRQSGSASDAVVWSRPRVSLVGSPARDFRFYL